MIFNSYSFILFALIFFSGLHLISRRWRPAWILAASYVFYGWWNVNYLALILLSTLIDYVAARSIDATESESRRRGWLVLSLVTNLSILFVFKYFNFFADSLGTILSTLGMNPDPVTLNVLLPVGISFYTFQSMGYTIDVYRGRIAAERNILVFATYIAFFPQLVAGPIERAAHLIPQLKALTPPTRRQISDGFALIILGYFLKVFIADNMARVVDHYYALGTVSGAEVILATLAFALQIYGDFAGYSKIARGIAKWLGVELMRNFNQPYFAASPSEFWRRWHISLSTWIRDYVYIPLGGSHHGRTRTMINLMLTMFLAGLWHGAAWTFVVWGVYHGLLLLIYHVMATPENKERGGWIGRWLSIGVMFVWTLYGWLLFRAESVAQIGAWTQSLLSGLAYDQIQDWPLFNLNLMWTLIFAVMVFVMDVIQERNQSDVLFRWKRARSYVLALIMIVLIVLFGGGSESFIYFQF